MLLNALWLVIETLGGLLATACVLRVWAGLASVHPRNPLSLFAVALTDWLVRPLRRLVPSNRRIDWASVLGALLLAMAMLFAQFLIFDGFERVGKVPEFSFFLIAAFLRLFRWLLVMLMVMTILQAILSWVNPYAPIAPALEQLTRPFLAPIRRVLPLFGGVDLSPLVLLLVVQFLMSLVDRTLPLLGMGI
jgi:YggT family protein